jgi:hypothetical protein
MSFFPPKRNFRALSVKDLLEARDAYHVHLAHLNNVVATAIGLYRIRKEDPDAERPGEERAREKAPKRTLRNTTVTKWSWPCVLVFVNDWRQQDYFASQPDQMVPRFLYLPDGRVVPTCVILAEEQEKAPPPLANLTFPSDLVGGGYPLLTDVQGQQHVASIGCLVTDGDAVYALTNRHVTGTERREVFTVVRGERRRLGVTEVARQVGKREFPDVYPGWPGSRVAVNLDAGLIRVEDVNDWTAQVFGIGELGEVADLNVNTISLDLIGCPVRAFGAASGALEGEIQALFYRYKSIGGFDYVADLLIGPRGADRPLATRPGDSGTLWVFDHEQSREEAQRQGNAGLRARRFRPIAVQWGGHTLVAPGRDGGSLQFALATFASTICRVLDVELLRDWNIGHNEYWGRVGHYKIGAAACSLVSDQNLLTLLQANLERIAFDDDSIRNGDLKQIDSEQFVPLADVPDFVWRKTRKKDEGNHFADLDEKGKGEFAGKTLLDLCQDPKNISIPVWNAFYDSLGVGAKRGALPFRVAELYQAMVEALVESEVNKFVCAAGVLAHYVGDACQPLHVSRLHHGRPDHPGESRVHSVYEENMMNQRAAEMIDGVNQRLGDAAVQKQELVKDAPAAARLVIELMRATVQDLPPMDVIRAFNGAEGRERVPHMWDVLGERTMDVVAAGCRCLAILWQSAWVEGKGNANIPANRLKAMRRDVLMRLYNDPEFLPARRLREMQEEAGGAHA